MAKEEDDESDREANLEEINNKLPKKLISILENTVWILVSVRWWTYIPLTCVNRNLKKKWCRTIY